MTIKIYHGEDIRRFKMDFSPDPQGNLTLLQERVISSFGFQTAKDFVVKYKDDENDLCTIQQSDELLEAVQLTDGSVMRLWVFPTSCPSQKPDLQKPEVRNAGNGASSDKAVPEFLDPILKAFNISEAEVEKCMKGNDVVKMLEVPINSVAQHLQKFAEGNSASPFAGFHQQGRQCGRQGRGCRGKRNNCRGNPIHWGVECDISGMNPIVGNRYHRMGDNYDLCETEFTKLEDAEKNRYELIRFPGCPAEKIQGEKLAARFVQDITVFDGTQVLPKTTLTKIWRMRNVGKTDWPEGTMLEHVGGDQMGSAEPVSIPRTLAGQDVDISIDLTAPEEEGRHVGYYRLRGPNGRRFGQRIWVMIQVVNAKNFVSNEVAASDLEEFKPEGEEQTSEVEKPVKEESETEPQTDTKTEVSTISTPAEDELPALEGDEDGKDEITSLVTSGSSDDFVDVKAEGSVLAAKLSEICKINLEDAEKFLTKNDESLVQAMIDNNLLRELRSAVAVTTSQEDPSTSGDITTNQLEQEKQEQEQEQEQDNQSNADSDATEYSVAMDCLKSMGFEGDHVVRELKKNQGRIEDTVKALLSNDN